MEEQDSPVVIWQKFWNAAVPYTYDNIWFWFIFCSSILVEPFFVGHRPLGVFYKCQIAFIVINTVLFLILLFANAEVVGKSEEVTGSDNSNTSTSTNTSTSITATGTAEDPLSVSVKEMKEKARIVSKKNYKENIQKLYGNNEAKKISW